jgi:hypothetical protein
MWRSILAVLFGYILIAALIHVTDRIFEAAIPGFRAMSMKPQHYFVMSLATDTVYGGVGGWVCALIAKTKKQYHVLALMVLAELIALVSVYSLWTLVPHYFSLGQMILTPVAICVGGILGSRSARAATAGI